MHDASVSVSPQRTTGLVIQFMDGMWHSSLSFVQCTGYGQGKGGRGGSSHPAKAIHHTAIVVFRSTRQTINCGTAADNSVVSSLSDKCVVHEIEE